jgi:hypothetical protein
MAGLTRRRALAAGIVVLACLLRADRPEADAPTARALLDRYSHGEFAAVSVALEHLDDFRTLLTELKADGPAWIAEGGPPDRPRRRLVAATLALEAARADAWREWKLVQHQPKASPIDTLYWQPPPLLIAWGAELLRAAGPPTPVERWWQLAAVAVAERAEDFEFLIGSPFEPRSDPGDEINFVPVLLARFPHEPRFQLAGAIAFEWRTWPAERRTTQGGKEAIDAFDVLSKDDSVGPEALVRLGEIRLRVGNPGAALALFDRADASTRDPYVVYLARFLRGQAFEKQKRGPEAILAYRAALAAVPRAQSASVALATQLFLIDRRADAAAVLNASLSGGPQPVDPWRTFADADDRFWPELIAHLRGVIAP